MPALDRIYQELRRIGAEDIRVSIDDDFDPSIGTLMKVQNGAAYWHLFPETMQHLLSELADDAGSGAVHQAIESKAQPLWHGPAPDGARE